MWGGGAVFLLGFSHIKISTMAQTNWFVDIVFQGCALGSCVSSFFRMADVCTRWVTRSVSLLWVSQGRFLHYGLHKVCFSTMDVAR